MKIGIDIDGVLTNEDDYLMDYTSKYCYENNLKLFNAPYEYEYAKFDWDLETIDDYRGKYFLWNYIDEEPARKFASEVIKKLKQDGHEIYIITGRYKCAEDSEIGNTMRTKITNWLKKNDIIYDEAVFSPIPKNPEIKSREIDIMIEDSPTTIPSIAQITHVLCYDTKYNRDLQCDNMTRVFSWYDIYMKINEMMQNKEV